MHTNERPRAAVRIRLEMLGGVRIFSAGEEVSALNGQRTPLALLVVLALLGEADREFIVSLLWPDSSPRRARHTLSQTLYKLRSILGADCIETRGEQISVRNRLSTDVSDFESHLNAGDVETALAVYIGPLLGVTPLGVSNAFEIWADTHRARLARAHKQLMRAFLESCARQGRFDRAIEVATRAVTADPTDDEAQHRLIEALAASGQTLEALAQFERYAAALAADDLEPLEQTLELVRGIREHVAIPAAELPVSTSPATAAPVATSGEAAAVRTAEARAAVTPTGAKARFGWKRRWPAYAAILVALAVAFIWHRVTQPSEIRLPAPDPIRIQVFEFEELNPPAGGALGAMLADRVADRLSDVGRFAVIGSGRLRLLRERGIGLGDTSSAVPDYVVTGTIERAEPGIALAIRLVDPDAQRVLESIRVQVDGTPGGVPPDDVVEGIVESVRRAVGMHQTARIAAPAHSSSETREMAAQASMQTRQADRLMRAGQFDAAIAALARADSLLASAERISPRWSALPVSRAHVAHTRATHVLTALGPAAARDAVIQLLEQALEHARRAGAIDATGVDPLEIRGLAAYRLSTMVAPDSADALRHSAERDLATVVERDSMRSDAWRVLSNLYWREADFASAKVAAQRAWDTDAFLESASANAYRLAMSLFELGADADARRWCEAGRAREPSRPEFHYCLLFLFAFAEPPARSAEDVLTAAAAADSAIHPQLRPTMSVRHRLLAATALLRLGLRDSAVAVAGVLPQDVSDSGLLWYEAAWLDRIGAREAARERLRRLELVEPDAAKSVVNSRVFVSLRAASDGVRPEGEVRHPR